MAAEILNRENYAHGFLIDDEWIAGVTPVEVPEGGVMKVTGYSAYVSHYLTTETIAYEEFDSLEPALEFVNKIERQWRFEGVGCSKHQEKVATTSTKSGGGCAGCSCG